LPPPQPCKPPPLQTPLPSFSADEETGPLPMWSQVTAGPPHPTHEYRAYAQGAGGGVVAILDIQFHYILFQKFKKNRKSDQSS